MVESGNGGGDSDAEESRGGALKRCWLVCASGYCPSTAIAFVGMLSFGCC